MSKHQQSEPNFMNRLSRLTDRLPGASQGVRRQSRMSDNGVRMTSAPGEQEEYEQFLSSAAVLWTLIDQQRLMAMNALYKRMLEYHNNIHVKDTALHPVLAADAEDNDELMVAQAIHFSTDKLEKPVSITFGDLNAFCSKAKEEIARDANGIHWIHIRDLIALQTIANSFDIHELISTGFQDLRAHSSFIPAFKEALITQVTCLRENNDFNMYKMYIYMSKNVVITFQAELLPDIMDPELSTPDKLVNNLFENYVQLRKRCLKYGAAYLLYEISLQTLKALDSAMEFISYALSYFNRVVHLRLLHRERLAILVKMHMIASAIKFFKDIVSDGNATNRSFVTAAMASFDANPSGIGRLLHANVIQEHHVPYLLDLLDSFEFVMDSLSHQLDESQRLDQKLDSTMQLRATNTSILLSLIATIFLPLTFFAGVFGMNFTVDGGFTIGMLNDAQGPAIFYWMCAGTAVASFAFFVYQGWVDIGFVGRMIRCLDCTSKIDDSLLDEDEQAEAFARAKEEEQRRRDEADARRSFQAATRNVERVMNIRASNAGVISARPTFSAVGGVARSVDGTVNPMVSSATSVPPGTIVIKRRRMSALASKRVEGQSTDSSMDFTMSAFGEEGGSESSGSHSPKEKSSAFSLIPFRESMSTSAVGGTADII
jgi:Mg2+ and Co2+ transporter CorA